jgi:hypothetical protein
VQEPESLTPKAHRHVSDTGNIASGPVEALDKARFDWVHACAEDDRNRCGQAFDHPCRPCTGRSGDDRYATSDEIGGQFRQTIALIVGPAIFDRDVTALVEA